MLPVVRVRGQGDVMGITGMGHKSMELFRLVK